MSNIRQNLFFAFIYNAAGVPIAAGVLYPIMGVLLSPVIGAGDVAVIRQRHRQRVAPAFATLTSRMVPLFQLARAVPGPSPRLYVDSAVATSNTSNAAPAYTTAGFAP